MLTCAVTIKKDGAAVWTGSKAVSPSGGTYSMVSLPTIQNISSGSYIVTVTATDPKGMSDMQTINFTVNDLGISGAVSHTSKWEENRLKYNQAATLAGRSTHSADEFFPGEKYMLTGTTTVIDPSSSVSAQAVTASISGTSYSTVLNKISASKFNGSLWNENMLRWDDRSVDFIFTVTYSNGTVKSTIVRTYIADDEYWRLHMLF